MTCRSPAARSVHRAACALLPAACAVLLAAGCASTRDRRTAYLDVIRPDQRPPLVAAHAAADSLFGPAGESDRADGIAESRRPGLEALVRRFTPTLVLPAGDHVRRNGRTYQLMPCDPRIFGDTLLIDRISTSPYGLSGVRSIPIRDLPPDSLAALTEAALRYESDPGLLEVWYFDFPGEVPREWWEAYARLRAGPDSARWARPVVWAHPFLDGGARTVIQYWYFYPFNDYIGNHEGDWEHVNVVVAARGDSVEEVHYYFHGRSARLPQGTHRPEIVDGTHPVVYVGGRAYMVADYPMRLLGGERNSGSHGNFPYPGEWEAASALGMTESVSRADAESARVVSHERFETVLTPEPSRIEYRRAAVALNDWAWLLLPVRWGFPSGPSLGSSLHATDVGNRAPFGPAFNAGWNRTAPGLAYSSFHIRRIPALRSYIEDLLQPWYYLYAFRRPRFVHDTRGTLERSELERLGLSPRSGWAERGMGSPLLGAHIGIPLEKFGEKYRTSPGFLLWREFWAKARFGGVELSAGYQRFRRLPDGGGSLFLYPFTVGVALRGPEGLVRPYAAIGAGPSGWESRIRAGGGAQAVTSGFGLGAMAGVGLEYYLRPRVALDVSVRYLDLAGPGGAAGLPGDRVRFVGLWVGHYVRF